MDARSNDWARRATIGRQRAPKGAAGDYIHRTPHLAVIVGAPLTPEPASGRSPPLIQEAKKQQNSSSSSGGASSSSSSSSPKPQPGKQGGQPEDGGDRSDGDASDSTEGDPPAPRHGDVNQIFDESRTEWGSLPQRIRDMLLQGRKEKFSSLYERLTREYYRRLAEEGSP